MSIKTLKEGKLSSPFFFLGLVSVSGSLFSSACQVVYLKSTFSLIKNSFTEVHLM